MASSSADDQYAALISQRLNMSVTEFEDSVKNDIVVRRLQALIAGGVTVGDQEVRDTYRKQNIKIKFDYAIISSDDLRKTINPSDSDLEAFFKKNARALCLGGAGRAQDYLFCVYAEPDPGRRSAADAAADSAVLQRAPVRVFGAGTGAVASHPDLGACGRRRANGCGRQGQGRGNSEAACRRAAIGPT